jgi:hypothetical protein
MLDVKPSGDCNQTRCQAETRPISISGAQDLKTEDASISEGHSRLSTQPDDVDRFKGILRGQKYTEQGRSRFSRSTAVNLRTEVKCNLW